MLEAGMVPTARVAPFLRRHLEESGDPGSSAHGSLPRVLRKWEVEQEWAEFDSVDRIFCMISDTPVSLWLQIEDVYYGCNLGLTRQQTAAEVKERVGGRDVFSGTCPHGHARTPENVYVSPKGWVNCRLCRAAEQKKRRSTTRMAA